MEVHAVLVNTGGFDAKEILAIQKHAKALGIHKFICLDETENYYRKVVKYLLFGNILKNNTYPLSVSAERISQAIAIAHHVKKLNAAYVAHGSTGAGNDQVRFDLIFNTLIPNTEIITPIRDQKLSRNEEVEFLKYHAVKMNFEKSAYSINKGLWGTSVGGKETLTSHLPLPESAWPTAQTKTGKVKISLYFEKGEFIGINNKILSPITAIQQLNLKIKGFGIGRDTHVGDTIIGIKGRVGFEAPAPLLILKAHHLLEKHVLTKWQLYWKDQLSAWYGNWLHEGQYLDPVMRNMEAFLEDSQKHVTGTVFVEVRPGKFDLLGLESKNDLMSPHFGRYGEENISWNGSDVKGFTKIFGNQIAILERIHEKIKSE